VFTEQELNAQIGSALCLAAAIDAAPDPEPGRLGKVLVPRMERLVRSEGYKARFAGLVVVGSVIGVGGARGIGGGIGGLVKCLVGFLSSEDWNSRKAAAEALRKLAVVERDGVAEFKSECLKVFENRRFDKVFFFFCSGLIVLVLVCVHVFFFLIYFVLNLGEGCKGSDE
jgi:hypothetical protein